MKTLNILMVDDHPLTIEGYIGAISLSMSNVKMKFDKAYSLDQAYEMIKNQSPINRYDLFFLDLKMPASKNGKMISGEQLAEEIKKIDSDAKIIFLTMVDDIVRLTRIVRNIDPEGIFVKSELDSESLAKGLEQIIENPPFYSPLINKKLRAQRASQIEIDDRDISILYYISQGVKTKYLPDYVPLSIRAIESRKRKLRDVFDVKDSGDMALVEAAKDSGYL